MSSSEHQTAPIVLGEGDGRHIRFTNSLLTIKATAEETDGRFSLIDRLAPAGHETPYHVHHEEGHELFYVIGGRSRSSTARRPFGDDRNHVYLLRISHTTTG